MGYIKRVAKTMPSQQRLRYISLLPGMDVVGIHQIFEVRERNDGKTKGQSRQDDHREQSTGSFSQSPGGI